MPIKKFIKNIKRTERSFFCDFFAKKIKSATKLPVLKISMNYNISANKNQEE